MYISRANFISCWIWCSWACVWKHDPMLSAESHPTIVQKKGPFHFWNVDFCTRVWQHYMHIVSCGIAYDCLQAYLQMKILHHRSRSDIFFRIVLSLVVPTQNVCQWGTFTRWKWSQWRHFGLFLPVGTSHTVCHTHENIFTHVLTLIPCDGCLQAPKEMIEKL